MISISPREKKPKRVEYRHILLPCGKSLSRLIRFRSHPLKFGIIFAFAAWLMQLSVFLTPIFAKQIGVGFGVCAELSVFSQISSTAKPSLLKPSSPTSVPSNDAMSGMSMADMPHMMDMQNPHSAHLSRHTSNHSLQHISAVTKASTISSSKVLTPSLLQPHVEPHHQNHAKCEFCLLLGYSVLPPLYVVIAVLLTFVIVKITVKANVADAIFLNQNKNLRPQGRAPPQFIS